jgi:hypothetical protein
MAIMNGGLFGKSTKKLGNVVMRKWKTKNTASAYQPNVKNPKTDAQVQHRSKFASLNQALKGIKNTILPIGFINPNKHIGLWADVVKFNAKLQNENNTLKYPEIILSKGNLRPPVISKSFYNNFLDQFTGHFLASNLPEKIMGPFKTKYIHRFKAGAALAKSVKRSLSRQEHGKVHCGCGDNSLNVENVLAMELAEKAFYFYTGAFLDTDGVIKPAPPLCMLPGGEGTFTCYADYWDPTDDLGVYTNFWVCWFLIMIEVDSTVAEKIQNINQEHFNNWDANDFSNYIIESINFVPADILSSVSFNKVYDVADSVFSQTERMVPELIYGGTREGIFYEDIINFVGYEDGRRIFKMTWDTQHCPHGTLDTDFVNVFLWIPDLEDDSRYSSFEKVRFSDGELIIELIADYDTQPVFVAFQLTRDKSLLSEIASSKAGNELATKVKRTTVNLPSIEYRAEFLWERCNVQPASMKFKNNVGGFAADLRIPGHIILPTGDVYVELSSEKLDQVFNKKVISNGKVVIPHIPPSDDYKVSIIVGAETFVIEKTYTISPHFIHQAENIMNENFHVVETTIRKSMIEVRKSYNGNNFAYPDATVAIKDKATPWTQNHITNSAGKSTFKQVPVPKSYDLSVLKNNVTVQHPDGISLAREQEGQTIEIKVEVDENDVPQRIIP